MCWRVKKGNYSNFPSLEEIVDNNESLSVMPSICEKIVAHSKGCRRHLIDILIDKFIVSYDV